MTIELKKIEPWQKAINAISSFISEGNFHFSDKGVSFRAIDPSQILLVDLFLDKKIFDRYAVEPSFVGVDIAELSKIMLRTMPGDKMVLDLTENEMFLTFEGELVRKFNLPLIDVSEEEAKIPNVGFDSRIEISSRIFREVLKDAALFGSSAVFNVKKGKFSIEAKGSQGTMRMEQSNGKSVSVKSSADSQSKYSLNFLQNIAREADADKKIVLEMKTDSPMKVSYPIGGSEISFYLAHMIL